MEGESKLMAKKKPKKTTASTRNLPMAHFQPPPMILEEDIKKKYPIIYADPPWEYNVVNSGKPTISGSGYHYPLMKDKDIMAMNVHKICEKKCHLLLWTTLPKIEVAMLVIRRWGFRYVTVAFVWVKMTKDGVPVRGPGNYTQPNAEIVLLATTGQLKVNSLAASQIIFAPRLEHSAKPPETRDRIVKIWRDRPRIELFARGTDKGWDGWGLEYEGDTTAQQKRK